MRIVLTGATGFLGREIAREARARGHVVAGLVRRPEASRPGDILGDFLDPDSYRDALRAFAPDALIHCGWHGVAASEREFVTQLDNVPATARLALECADAGARIAIGLGTQAEYGMYASRVREDHVGAPVTLYAIAKRAAGAAFLRLAERRGMRAVWARIFSLYGPGETAPTLLPGVARMFAQARTPDLTACTQIWDFVHVRDAARAICDLAACDDASGFVNVASGEELVLRDTVLALRDVMAPSIAPRFGALPFGAEQIMYLAGDVAKLRALTGWRPEISLVEGLREVAEEAWRDVRAQSILPP